jgi:hypothetical protein
MVSSPYLLPPLVSYCSNFFHYLLLKEEFYKMHTSPLSPLCHLYSFYSSLGSNHSLWVPPIHSLDSIFPNLFLRLFYTHSRELSSSLPPSSTATFLVKILFTSCLQVSHCPLLTTRNQGASSCPPPLSCVHQPSCCYPILLPSPSLI